MDSNSAPNNLHCTTVIVSYMKLAVGQELVTFYILHLDLQLYCITDLVYCSVTVKICHLLSFYSAPHRIARQPCRGGRGPLFTPQQEEAICAMVIANNAIRLREIQSAVIEDDNIFGNIESVSIATIDRVLRRNEMRMKQLYNVPFERNSDRVKEIRHQYVQVKHVCVLCIL